ncbi:MAG: outer membrane protein assembly factor BamB [Gammaproteobacteria bacterium]|nr:outer membrane protein assembly factor BamB [Gammaproteobacteria bacterium]
MTLRQHSAEIRRAAAPGALLLGLLLVACSKDKTIDEPAKLTPLPHPSVRVTRLWGHNMGDKKAAVLRLGQGVSIADNRVYAAGHSGEVAALDLATGRLLWRAKTGAPNSGGTSASADLLLVGASDGELFAFDPANGHSRWKVRLNGEVLAPAAISARLIAVRTVDGKLHALNPEDGHELWTIEQQVPRLSLRGTASPVISGDLVLSGFDNGKVVAVNAADGSVQWEATVTPPHGRTELERLDDIDSPIRVSGRDVYAVGFQGKVAMLALDTGQVWWSHDESSYRGITLDEDTLYLADSDGIVAALKSRTGAEVWRQNVLLHRGLSPIAVMDDTVLVGDFQGYLHFLDKASGALAARVASGGARISTQPLVVGDIVVVANDRGQINAYRVKPLAAAGTTRKTSGPQDK